MSSSRKRIPAWGPLLLLMLAAGLLHLFLREDPATLLSAAELQQQLRTEQPPLLLDVRTLAEFRTGHIPKARHLDHRNLEKALPELQAYRDQTIVLYCETGARSRTAKRRLEQQGFTRVYHLRGDMVAWRRQGLPIRKP